MEESREWTKFLMEGERDILVLFEKGSEIK